MFYTEYMDSRHSHPPQAPSMISLKLGGWLQATATGWGVVALAIIVLSLLGVTLVRVLS
jgi:hypothetical protein